MNALSIPIKGILRVEDLEQALSKGVNQLAKKLCPDQWLEESTHATTQQACIWALIEQLKLRDEYIHKCLTDLGIDIPPEPYTVDITPLPELDNRKFPKVDMSGQRVSFSDGTEWQWIGDRWERIV